MDTTQHDLPALFAQLGLPNTPEAIRDFIQRHRPLDGSILLRDAPFWTPAQSALLRESVGQDSDWALVVDGLSARLRDHPEPADLPQG